MTHRCRRLRSPPATISAAEADGGRMSGEASAAAQPATCRAKMVQHRQRKAVVAQQLASHRSADATHPRPVREGLRSKAQGDGPTVADARRAPDSTEKPL